MDQRKQEVISINSKKNILPVFGKDIVDDWSWDREEEEMRECHEDSEEDSNANE